MRLKIGVLYLNLIIHLVEGVVYIRERERGNFSMGSPCVC